MAFENNGIVLYLLIGAVLIALVVTVVMMWRKVRFQSSRNRRTVARAVVVRKSGLWEIVRRLVMRIVQRVRFEVRYWMQYNSLPGLLVWTERRMSRRGIKRGVGETAAAYLTRIGERYPNGRMQLDVLSAELDRYYFGGGEDLPKEAVRELRKNLRSIKSNET